MIKISLVQQRIMKNFQFWQIELTNVLKKLKIKTKNNFIIKQKSFYKNVKKEILIKS